MPKKAEDESLHKPLMEVEILCYSVICDAKSRRADRVKSSARVCLSQHKVNIVTVEHSSYIHTWTPCIQTHTCTHTQICSPPTPPPPPQPTTTTTTHSHTPQYYTHTPQYYTHTHHNTTHTHTTILHTHTHTNTTHTHHNTTHTHTHTTILHTHTPQYYTHINTILHTHKHNTTHT